MRRCAHSTVGLIGSNQHVGHFTSSSVCSAELRYALENLRPQCYACNIYRSGNWPAYEQHLIRDGIDVDELKWLNERTKGMQATSFGTRQRLRTIKR